MESQVRLAKLEREILLWRLVLLLLLLLTGGKMALEALQRFQHKGIVRVTPEGGDFRIFQYDSYSEQAVITHLAYAHDVNHLFSAAILHAPLRMESGGYTISGKGLIWLDSNGDPAKGPTPKDTVFAVYVEAKKSREYERWWENRER
ncbi:MAG TPA: hypothetical protein VEX38_04370 [Fimbriimonadaceae bacterium]|nr:hypothetical protein [Fimbriimonadaceae bacterium]